MLSRVAHDERIRSGGRACAPCHPDGTTDGQSHKVARKATADRLDTPSLRFIGSSAPCFHDGRYPAPVSMLDAPDHTMGQSMHPPHGALLACPESL